MVLTMACLGTFAGCDETASDYSILEPGDIPRPEFEFILDLEDWLDKFGIEDMIDPFMWDILDGTGFNSLRRTNLVAYEREDYIAVECYYELDDAEDTIVGKLLDIEFTESTLLGRLDPDAAMISIYFSGGRDFLKNAVKGLTDPYIVESLFEGDSAHAISTRQSAAMGLGMLEGAILRHFGDECLFVLFPNPGYPSAEAPIPGHGVLIVPTESEKLAGYEIANFMKSFSYLAALFEEELRDVEVMEFKETEVEGYPCVYLDLGEGMAISMVDADGYFSLGGFDGITAALDSFDRRKASYDSPEEADIYCRINYDVINDSVLVPLYEAGIDPGHLNLMVPEPLLEAAGIVLDQLINQIEDLEEISDATVWADFSLCNCENGYNMKVRMQTDLAEYSLDNFRAYSEMLDEQVRF